MARTLESKGIIIAGSAVIVLCVAINIWLFCWPPFSGTTTDTGSATEQSAQANTVDKSSKDKKKTTTDDESADTTDTDETTDTSTDEIDITEQGTEDTPNGETTTDYVDGLSVDSSQATDSAAQLDATTVPVPTGVDATAFQTAVVDFANTQGIGCITDLVLTTPSASSANGYSWWDMQGSISGNGTDTYLRVYMDPTGTFSVVRR